MIIQVLFDNFVVSLLLKKLRLYWDLEIVFVVFFNLNDHADSHGLSSESHFYDFVQKWA